MLSQYFNKSSVGYLLILIGWIKVLRPTRHKMSHFGNVLLSQSIGLVLNKL